MLKGLLFDEVFTYLERGLDYACLRQRVIANNLANVNTPGFKRGEVSFSDAFARARDLDPGRESGFFRHPAPIVRQITLQDVVGRNDLNNVDVEAEMTKLAETSLYYEAVVRQLSRRIASVRTVISEGRR